MPKMYQHYKESNLPLTYRRQEIKAIANTIAVGRSVRVAGLSGMGKSNLLRFLVSHPQLLDGKLPPKMNDVYFIHIDCNRLKPVNASSFYRECNSELEPEGDLSRLMTDEYILYRQLERSLQQIDSKTLVILVIDQIQKLYNVVDEAFFGQLRALRDEARAGQMIFIFCSQKPVAYMYELEKMFSYTCWVGPFSKTEQQTFFKRHEERLGLKVDEGWRTVLWNLSGGHPGLLKNSINWLREQKERNPFENENRLLNDLLHYDPIKNYCAKLWSILNEEEQQKVGEVLQTQALPNTETKPALYELKSASWLKEAGLVVETGKENKLFSPLWIAYLKQVLWTAQETGPMQIELDDATRRVVLQWRGKTVDRVINRPLVFKLLQAFTDEDKTNYKSKDMLIDLTYGEAMSDDALFRLISDLRKTLDNLVKELCLGLPEDWSCIENARGVGYRLIVNLPEDIC